MACNPLPRGLSEEQLCLAAPGATILLTHWGAPQITRRYLAANPRLRLIAHCAGTVAHIASEDTYAAGIPCLSANPVMARYVAEAVLGLLISRMRGYKENDLLLQRGIWTKELPAISLLDATVGLIGLGTVGRCLLDLLAPFGTRVLVYDPYLPADVLAPWPNAEAATFEEALGGVGFWVNASQTRNHMIDEAAFPACATGRSYHNPGLVDTRRREMIPENACAPPLMFTGRTAPRSPGRSDSVLPLLSRRPRRKNDGGDHPKGIRRFEGRIPAFRSL